MVFGDRCIFIRYIKYIWINELVSKVLSDMGEDFKEIYDNLLNFLVYKIISWIRNIVFKVKIWGEVNSGYILENGLKFWLNWLYYIKINILILWLCMMVFILCFFY